MPLPDPQPHALGMGKVFGNLQSLEYLLRVYLYDRAVPPHTPLPGGYDIHSARVGDVLPENALTSFHTLGQLIDLYNDHQPDQSLHVDRSVVGLRDALAHGRISGLPAGDQLELLKFSRPKQGLVIVEVSESMTADWYVRQVGRTLAELQKVALAVGAKLE